jgi:hypothetical protein
LPGVVAYSPCSKLLEGTPKCNQFVGYWALKSETKTIVGSKALRLEIYTSTPAILNEIKVSYENKRKKRKNEKKNEEKICPQFCPQ